MRILSRLVAVSAFGAGALADAGLAGARPARAAPQPTRGLRPSGARHFVFVQTDNPAGNAIISYHRRRDGTLRLAGRYPTGGLGGQLAGSVVDHLASQGSLSYDPGHGPV